MKFLILQRKFSFLTGDVNQKKFQFSDIKAECSVKNHEYMTQKDLFATKRKTENVYGFRTSTSHMKFIISQYKIVILCQKVAVFSLKSCDFC